ncbi:Uncharacterised protein [Dorea longicatena]|nr:Uncharacterised protein [Dorea longicatena]
MTREALKKLNEKQMNYCKTLSALIDRAKIKGLKEENERNRGKLRGFLECMEQMELLSGYEVKALLPAVQILRYMPLGRTGKCRTTKRGNNNAFGDREQQAA